MFICRLGSLRLTIRISVSTKRQPVRDVGIADECTHAFFRRPVRSCRHVQGRHRGGQEGSNWSGVCHWQAANGRSQTGKYIHVA